MKTKLYSPLDFWSDLAIPNLGSHNCRRQYIRSRKTWSASRLEQVLSKIGITHLSRLLVVPKMVSFTDDSKLGRDMVSLVLIFVTSESNTHENTRDQEFISFILKKTLLSKATLFKLQNFANCKNLATCTDYRSCDASDILHWLCPSWRKSQKSELSLEKQNVLQRCYSWKKATHERIHSRDYCQKL